MLTQTALTPLPLSAPASGLSNTLPVRFYHLCPTPWSVENKEFSDSLRYAACMVEATMNFESRFTEQDDAGAERFNFSRCLKENKMPSNVRLQESSGSTQFEVSLTQSAHSRAIGRKPVLVDCSGVQSPSSYAVFECTKKENPPHSKTPTHTETLPEATATEAATPSSTPPVSEKTLAASITDTARTTSASETTEPPASSNTSDLMPPRLPSPPLRDKNSKPRVVGGFPWSSVAATIGGTLGMITTAAVYFVAKKASDKGGNRQEAERQPAQEDELKRLRNSESCV